MEKIPSRQEMKRALEQSGVTYPPIDISPIDVVSSRCIYLTVCDDIKADRYDLETFSQIYATRQRDSLISIRNQAREQFDRQAICLPWDEGLMV